MSVAEAKPVCLEEIITALRAVGCSVAEVRDLVPGVTALLVGYSGSNIILMPPTDSAIVEDVDFRIAWRGRIAAVSNTENALRAVFGAVRPGPAGDGTSQVIETLEATLNQAGEILHRAEQEHKGYKQAVLAALGVLRDVS